MKECIEEAVLDVIHEKHSYNNNSLHISPYSLSYFFKKGAFTSELTTKEKSFLDTDVTKPKFIFCRFCGYKITNIKEQIIINGKFLHNFTNPSGISYEIACFRHAVGCYATGTPTDEFTWFPSYSWSYALCSSCLNHLGWKYEKAEDIFFGLILENLIEEE